VRRAERVSASAVAWRLPGILAAAGLWWWLDLGRVTLPVVGTAPGWALLALGLSAPVFGSLPLALVFGAGAAWLGRVDSSLLAGAWTSEPAVLAQDPALLAALGLGLYVLLTQAGRVLGRPARRGESRAGVASGPSVTPLAARGAAFWRGVSRVALVGGPVLGLALAAASAALAVWLGGLGWREFGRLLPLSSGEWVFVGFVVFGIGLGLVWTFLRELADVVYPGAGRRSVALKQRWTDFWSKERTSLEGVAEGLADLGDYFGRAPSQTVRKGVASAGLGLALAGGLYAAHAWALAGWPDVLNRIEVLISGLDTVGAAKIEALAARLDEVVAGFVRLVSSLGGVGN
jgi:hypothetical protein